MFKLAFIGLWRHKARVFFISLTVILGVSFATSIGVLSNSIRTSLAQLDNITAGQADLVVRVDEASGLADFELAKPEPHPEDEPEVVAIDIEKITINIFLSADLITQIKSLSPQIQDVVGVIEGEQDFFIYKDGEALQQNSPINLMSSWVENTDLNDFIITAGRPPSGFGEIVLDAKTAEDNTLRVGDNLQIVSYYDDLEAEQDFQVVGLASYKTLSDQASGSFIGLTLFEVNQLRQLSNLAGTAIGFDAIRVRALQQADLGALSRAVDQILPPGLEVQTKTELAQQDSQFIENLDDFVAAISYVLLFFVTLAMLVGVFVIINTFNVLLAQRAKELALLRALAFSKARIQCLVILEGLLIGIFATVVGLGLGVAFGQLVLSLVPNTGIILPTTQVILNLDVFIYPLILGILITVLASLLPAWRASRLSPVAVLTETDQLKPQSLLLRIIFGGLLIFINALIILWSLTNIMNADNLNTPVYLVNLWAFLLGCGGLFLGVIIFTAVLMRPFTKLLRGLFKRGTKISFRLAIGNIWREPKRAALAVNTLVIGMTLIVVATTLIHSLKASSRQLIEQIQPADWQITIDYENLPPAQQKFNPAEISREFLQPIPPPLVEKLQALPEIKLVSPVRYNYHFVNVEVPKSTLMHYETDYLPQTYSLANLDGQTFEEVINLNLDEATVANFKAGQILVSDYFFLSHNLQVGDELNLQLGDYRLSASYIVGGKYNPFYIDNMDFMLDEATFTQIMPNLNSSVVLLDADDSFSDKEVQAVLEDLIVDYPGLAVFGKITIIEFIDNLFNFILNIFLGLLGLSLFVAFLGIFNILSLAVIERTKEIGILRALGLSRWQALKMIGLEAVIMVSGGVLLGIALGVLFAWLGFQVFTSSGFLPRGDDAVPFVFAIPVVQLISYSLMALAVALVAALWPAIKAARLNIIKALTSR